MFSLGRVEAREGAGTVVQTEGDRRGRMMSEERRSVVILDTETSNTGRRICPCLGFICSETLSV